MSKWLTNKLNLCGILVAQRLARVVKSRKGCNVKKALLESQFK